MTTVLDVQHLEKRYGTYVAVEDVTFSVDEGEIFGILGPNGAGKTTTVECLQGLRRADAGELEVLGYDPRVDAKQVRRQIGSQLQESALPIGSRCGRLSTCSPPWHPVDSRGRA